MERYQTARVFHRDPLTDSLTNTQIIVEFTPGKTTLGEMKAKVADAAAAKGYKVNKVILYAYDNAPNSNILGKQIDERHSNYVFTSGGGRRRTRRSKRSKSCKKTRRV